MGRKAGVTAEQTRGELLAAAARVFAQKGYDGASIADITAAAGLSSGAIYAHYGGKAELFAAVLLSHGPEQYGALIGRGEVANIADFVQVMGSSYDRREARESELVVEAIVASKRDAEVARLVSTFVADAEALLTSSIRAGQESGVLDPGLSAEAIGRFAMTVALGSSLASALRLPTIDHEGWTQLIQRLVDATRTPS